MVLCGRNRTVPEVSRRIAHTAPNGLHQADERERPSQHWDAAMEDNAGDTSGKEREVGRAE